MNLVNLVAACLSAATWGADRDWRPETFDYDRPAALEVDDLGEPANRLPETRQQELTFRNLRGESVPVLVTRPPKGKGPFPVVLLVHPLGGDRHQMSREMGKALTTKGYACVALDLPMHGSRAEKGKGEELFIASDAEQTYKNIVGAVMDIRQTIDLIKQRKDLDSDKGLPVVGYSLGAWFGTLAGSADRRVSMLILMGAGAGDPLAVEAKGGLPKPQNEQSVLREHPTLRLETAIVGFGRPLLMQNGKKDPFISEDSAKNLYRLAKSPKELKWYDCGHIMPEKASTDAVEWMSKTATGH